MKSKLQIAGCGLLLAVLAGCNSVKGTYACNGGVFLKTIKLDSDDKAMVTGDVWGQVQQKAGTYKVDGDNVMITVDGQAIQFVHKDKTLDGGPIAGKCVAE